MEIVIIGSGNVATAIGRKMLSAGHPLFRFSAGIATMPGYLQTFCGRNQ